MVGIGYNSASVAGQRGLMNASVDAASSAQRLVTGEAITKLSDDVAGYAVGKAIQTQIAGLKAAAKNTAQASTLLDTAASTVGEIQKMLSRQNELSKQALSGGLDDTTRSYVNAESAAISEQIDFTAKNANFNNTILLDGSLYNKSSITTSTSSVDQKASMTITAKDLTNTKTFTINGVTFTAKTTLAGNGSAEFVAAAGTSAAQTLVGLTNLVNAATSFNDPRLKELTFTVGAANPQVPTLTIESNTAGMAGTMIQIGKSSDTALFTDWFTAGEGNIAGASRNLYNSNITTGGLSEHNVETKGSVGDNLVKNLTAVKANGSINVTGLTTTAIATASNNQVTIATGNIVTAAGAGATTAIVTIADHGLKTNDSIQLTNGSNLVLDGLTFTDTNNFAITVIDRDHFRITASSGSTTAGGVASGAGVIITPGHVININGSEIVLKASPSAANEIAIGATGADTTSNLLSYLNKSTDANIASANYSLNSSGAIDITYKAAGAIGNNFYITSASSLVTLGGLLSGANTLQNGASTGINTSNIVNNPDFIGTISGFEADYASAPNRVNINIKIGDYTYSASNVNSNPTADTTIKFISDTNSSSLLNGGAFTIDLAANKGITVSSNTDSKLFADKLNAAFRDISFSQNRKINSYNAVGNVTTNGIISGRLDNTALKTNIDNFDHISVDAVSVAAPVAGSTIGKISVTINGEVFENASVAGGVIPKGQTLALNSTADSARQVFFINNADIDQAFDNDSKAGTFAKALSDALGLNQGKSTLQFQIGNNTRETVGISIKGTTTKDLYKDENGNSVTIDLSTAASAQAAQSVIARALNYITSISANVGALQSRMKVASSSLQTSIQNQAAAASIILDTDMGEESTKYANATLRQRGSIYIIVQANEMQNSLLELIRK